MYSLSEIGRPLHIHGVRTAADYLARQRDFIAALKAAKPYLPWRDPWECHDVVLPFVTHGYWKIICSHCGNAPSVDPDWMLACCFECGAIYRRLTLPPTRKAIEQALVQRPEMATRNWLPGETVADLVRETAAHV